MVASSWAIDYEATLNTYEQGRKAGMAHFVLLSAICVQKPLLEFQKAKLALEAKLRRRRRQLFDRATNRLFQKPRCSG